MAVAANVACPLLLQQLMMMIFLNLVDLSQSGLTDLNPYAKNYIEIDLDNETICHPLTRHSSSNKLESVTELRKFKDSAIMVTPSHKFDSWKMIKNSKHCKFKIKGPKEDNLFAVVQKMSLRRNGTECLDYIMFKAEESTYPPRKYCGKVESQNGVKRYVSGLDENVEHRVQNPNHYLIPIPESEIKMVEEFSARGKITTEIFISKQPLKPGESLDLVIAYTPYRDCNKVEDKTDVWSDPENPLICISKKFVCDGQVNCANALCRDEDQNCSAIVRIVSDEIGTKVTISAVTTMILCFIIFVMCFWICKKHEILCWSQDCAGPSVATGNSSSMAMDRGERSAASPPYVSTAPMLEVAVPSTVNDKDLPPSYDSLFPPQTNAANT